MFAKQIFTKLKSRWGIDTFYQYLKNRGDFNNLMIQDYYKEQGFAFIMLVAGQIHREMIAALKLLENNTLYALVRKHIAGAGLDASRYSSHKLRHTAATLMLQNGVDVRAVQEVRDPRKFCVIDISRQYEIRQPRMETNIQRPKRRRRSCNQHHRIY